MIDPFCSKSVPAVLRTGPRPLSVHLGMAACLWDDPDPSARDGKAEGSGIWQGQDNTPLSGEAKGLSGRMLRMLAGIRKYHEHPYRRMSPDRVVVWQRGHARLLYHPPVDSSSGQAVFLIPSLINGADILDLMPERSLVEWLGAQGIGSFLLDWGNLAADEGVESFDALFSSCILPAFDMAAECHKSPLHVLGYCMGGLLAAGLSGLRPDASRSLVLVASPWDFHAGDQTLGARVRAWAPGARAMTDSLGRLPVDWLQILFASVDPLMAAHKFVRFADWPQDSEAARIFVAVEDWLNGGSDLPAGIARICIEDWYGENTPARGAWRLLGRCVGPDQVACPVFVIASASDRLVPMESSLAFCAKTSKTAWKTLAPGCGHIGMMAGQRSVEEVWKPIRRWILAQGDRRREIKTQDVFAESLFQNGG